MRHNGGRLAPGYAAHSVRNHLITNDEFPLLDCKELCQCLQECDFEASEELLTRPSGAYIRQLFEQMLDTFIGLSPEYCVGTAKTLLKQSNGDVDAELDAGDAESDDTADTVGLIVVFRAAKMFVEKCGIDDFTLMDLMRPDGARTQRILSGVINFARFREEHLRECEHLAKELEDAVEELRRLEEANADFEKRIDKLQSRLGDERTGAQGEMQQQQQLSVLQLHKYNTKLEQELIKLQKSQEVFKKEHTSYKETKARLIEKLEDQHFLLSESERELSKMQGYASADPAIVRQVVADLSQHSQAAEEEVRGLETQVRNKTCTQQSIQSVEDELRSVIKIVQEITHDLQMLENANEKHTRQKEELASKQQASEELSVHLQRVKRQLQKCEEKTVKLRQQAVEKEHSAKERFQALEHEYDALTKARDVKQERLDRTRKENSEIEADIRKIQLEFELEKRNTESAVGKLNAHIRQYLDDISKHL